MATAYARCIAATPSRSTLKVQRFEPPTNPVSQLLLFKMPHVRISGCLSCDLFSLLSSCFSRCCSFLRVHFALFTSKFASGHRLCSQQPFELCFRLSTPLPTASILCGTMLGLNCCLLRPSHLDCDCLSLLVFLCALPLSLLGPDPFLHHPALLGPCKNAVNLAGGHLLSSLFSLLSSLCFLPSRLRTRRGQGHGDCICAMDSCDAITIHP